MRVIKSKKSFISLFINFKYVDIMKVYQTNEIKNIALLGNDGAGKTTLTEALLYESGVIKRRGRITAKNTVSDYFPVEQEYIFYYKN